MTPPDEYEGVNRGVFSPGNSKEERAALRPVFPDFQTRLKSVYFRKQADFFQRKGYLPLSSYGVAWVGIAPSLSQI
jgi:hypothetical protein